MVNSLANVVSIYSDIYFAGVSENTLEIMTEIFSDIVKCSFDLEMEETQQQMILEFIFKVATTTEKKYKSLSYTFEALGGYVRMLYASSNTMIDLCKNLLDVWILKSKYPYFFDTQVKKPLWDSMFYKPTCYINNAENNEEESDAMDDYNPETSLNEEETNFLKMRSAIRSLTFEFWLKIKNLEPILSTILDKGKQIIQDSEQIFNEEINYQLEALLDVFLHYLEGVRDASKIDSFMSIIDKISEFFLNENMKSIFVGQKWHCLLSK